MAKKRKAKAPEPKVEPPPPEEFSIIPEHVEIRCPLCQTHWANASIKFGKEINKSDFAPREDFKGKVKFQANGLPYCPVCNFKYDERAMYGLLIAAANTTSMERKLWERKS